MWRRAYWKNAHVVNVFFVLIATRVEVERSRIGYIASGVIRNNCDIVTDLVLIRIAFVRIKRSADCYVG